MLRLPGVPIIYLGRRSPGASSNLPPDIGRAILDCRYTRSCNPRDVRPDDIAASAVGSYPAFSPLPAVRSRRPAASHGSRRVPNLPPAGGHSLLRSHNLTAVKLLACVALCVARTFLPLLPGGDGADLRGKGMNKSGIKVNLFMFYHAKIFGTQSGQGKILQGIRLPLLIGCRRQGYPIWCRLRLVVRERGFPSDCNYFIIKNNVFIVCLCENYYNCIGLFCINQVDWKMIRNILVVFLLLFVGFSCDLKNRKTKNLRDIYGQNLILPGHATWKIEGRDTVINIENLAPKLVVYYSSGTCAPCSLKGLHHWGKIIDSVELVGPSLEIVFIIKANRYDSLFFHSLNSEHFIFPVLCDKEGEFEENNLLPINKEYNAFLLDSNNEVVYVGSPLLGRKMRSLFISIVKVLNNDYRNGVNSDLPSSDTIDNISS